jgi:hypothetical protein
MLLAGETMRDISIRFKACLTICNLAYHPQNRHADPHLSFCLFRRNEPLHLYPCHWGEPEMGSSSCRRHLKEAKALDLVSRFIEPENWSEATEKTSIWAHSPPPSRTSSTPPPSLLHLTRRLDGWGGGVISQNSWLGLQPFVRTWCPHPFTALICRREDSPTRGLRWGGGSVQRCCL